MLEFETQFHPAIRAVLLVFGVFAIAMPAWQLSPALWPLNAVTPFFLVIMLGAFSVGAAFISGAVRSDALRWRIAPGRIELERTNMLRRRTDFFSAADIEAIRVVVNTWDSRADTYRVEVALCNGAKFHTQDYDRRQAAEDFARRIAETLRG